MSSADDNLRFRLVDRWPEDNYFVAVYSDGDPDGEEFSLWVEREGQAPRNVSNDTDAWGRRVQALMVGKCLQSDSTSASQTRTFTFENSVAPNVINALSHWCHEANDTWWRDPATGEPIERNHGELMMLMVSEIAEAMEGQRKGLMDDKLPHRKMVEVELADCLIRIFDYAGAHGLDLGGAFVEKMRYNASRLDHRPEERLKEGGKKW